MRKQRLKVSNTQSSSSLKQFSIVVFLMLLPKGSYSYWLNCLSDSNLGKLLQRTHLVWTCLFSDDSFNLSLSAMLFLKDKDDLVSCPQWRQPMLSLARLMRDHSQPWESENIILLPRWSNMSYYFFLFIFLCQLNVFRNSHGFLSSVFKTGSTLLLFSSCYQSHREWFHFTGSSYWISVLSYISNAKNQFTTCVHSISSP